MTAKKSPAKKPVKRTRKPTTKKTPATESVSIVATPQAEPTITPIHQWTHDGDRVLLVKCVSKGGKSHNDFQWPKSGEVVTPNWSPEPNCESGGLFGWPWGLNLGEGKLPDYRGDWIVFSAKPESVVRIDGKAKAGPSAEVVFYGSWHEALQYTLAGRVAWIQHATRGAANCSGDYSSASTSGYSSSASTSGYCSSASTSGDYSSASTSGHCSSASTSGHYSSASTSGDSSSASTSGYCSSASSVGAHSAAALTGERGTIEVGPQAAGVVTAESFRWIVHLGAVILHRWTTGHALLTTEGLSEGQTVSVTNGIITAKEFKARLKRDNRNISRISPASRAPRGRAVRTRPEA